jgi:NTE family protein
MLRALVEHGEVPDLVLGCSVGALNGAAFAQEPTVEGVGRLEALWRGLDGKDVFPSGILPTAVQLARRGASIHGTDGLRRVIESVLRVGRFDDLAVAFQCVATAVDEGTEAWFDDGDLVAAILASAALPAVYPPVEIDGVRYIDGAVVNDIPLSRAVDLGADRVFVLHVGSFDRPRPSPRRPLDMALQAYWIARRHRFARDLAAVPPEVEVTVLPMGTLPLMRYNDFTRSEALIDQAYRASAAALDT